MKDWDWNNLAANTLSKSLLIIKAEEIQLTLNKNFSFPKFELQLMEIKPDSEEVKDLKAVELESLTDVQNSKEPSPEKEQVKVVTKKGKKRKRQNNYSNISKVVDGKKYARFGVLVPAHWMNYKDCKFYIFPFFYVFILFMF